MWPPDNPGAGHIGVWEADDRFPTPVEQDAISQVAQHDRESILGKSPDDEVVDATLDRWASDCEGVIGESLGTSSWPTSGRSRGT